LKEFRLGASTFLLQGQGPFVSVIDVASGRLVYKKKVFRRSNVYGFMIDELRCQAEDKTRVLVWGGSSLRIIDICKQDDNNLKIVCGSLEHAAPDWIYDICPAHIDDSSSLAYLVTGHNSVLSINIRETVDAKYPNAIQLRHLFAGVKSTLYSADILALSAEHILIAAGTVFGEIIVWSCFKHGSDGVHSSIHHFFTGHEGSIFGVDISGELPLADGKTGRLLASCSDDRTVRIWDISDCCYATSTDQAAYATDGFDLRSTGFGSTAPASISRGSELAVAKCWGHASRIWGIYFLPVRAEYPGVVNLVSRGEDATSLLWRLDLAGARAQGDMKLDLTNVSTLGLHAGKHIWSLALSKRDDDRKIVYTGGNDGTVRAYELTYVGKDGGNEEEPSISISPYSPKTLLKAARAKINNDGLAPRVFAFVSTDSFVITYASGLVQLGTLTHKPGQTATAKPEISWENVAVAEDLRSFSSISALSRHGLAVIGGSTGILRLYNHATKRLTELTKVSSRPVKIELLDADLNASKFRFMVAYPGSKNADLFDVEMAGGSYTIKQTELVTPPGLEISTSSIVCHGKYLALGGKLGQLLFYRLDARKESLEYSYIDHRMHGKAVVTFIKPIDEDDAENPNVGYVLTGGRDGKYCVYRLHSHPDREDARRDFQIIHRSSAFLSQVEGAYYDHQTGHFMVLGFRGNVLILWDETTQTEILALDCGGVHRVWEFAPSPEAIGAGTIVWIQARSLHVLMADSTIHRPLQLGTHGREVKSLAVAKTSSALIASGGEDTLIRISTRSQDTDGIAQCLQLMGDHVSGTQQIKWSDDGRFLFSSAGREEFFAWRIRSVPKFGLATLMEAACPRQELETELRIMSFDVRRMHAADGEDRFLLALVYSNSTIKVPFLPLL
jgi:WD repeat-containing protein 6